MKTPVLGGGVKWVHPGDRAGDMNPLAPFFEHQGFAMLDGGLSTQLERVGADLEGELWTSRVLIERPDLVALAHRQFLEGRADVLATATY